MWTVRRVGGCQRRGAAVDGRTDRSWIQRVGRNECSVGGHGAHGAQRGLCGRHFRRIGWQGRSCVNGGDGLRSKGARSKRRAASAAGQQRRAQQARLDNGTSRMTDDPSTSTAVDDNTRLYVPSVRHDSAKAGELRLVG